MRRSCLLLLTLLLTAIVTPVQAQQKLNPPIIMGNGAGDLWSWDGLKLTKRTNRGYNGDPVLSPDGKKVAYTSLATITVDEINRSGGIGGGGLPSDVWVLDIATGRAERLQDQPSGALFVSGRPGRWLSRSEPAWSPDSKAIAWIETLWIKGVNEVKLTNRLVVYNFSTSSAKILVPNVPLGYGVPQPLPVQWGTGGFTVIDADGGLMYLYDTSGKLIQTTQLSSRASMWIKDGPKDYVAVFALGRWMLLDPVSRTLQVMDGAPELYSLTAPEGYSVFPVGDFARDADWMLGEPGKPPVKLDDLKIYDYNVRLPVAISPDGTQVVFRTDPQHGNNEVRVYRDGQFVLIESGEEAIRYMSGLVWGPVGWRVRPAP
jgi:hypothetical protein